MELNKAFGVLLEAEVISRLQSLQGIFQLSAEDIFLNWETYNVSEVQENVDLTVGALDAFQEYLQKHLVKNTPGAKKIKETSSGIKRRPLKPINSSPEKKFRKFDSSPYQTANSTFESPTKPSESANTVIESLGQTDDIENDIDDENYTPKIQIGLNFDPAKYKFRTMSMDLLESADVLDEQIDTFGALVQEAHKNDKEPITLANPCESTQFSIHCVGRIVPDTPMHDKLALQDLNATSLHLETSRLTGIGQRVPIDLSQVKEYSLFPGQIVCLKGKNPSRTKFIVEEIISLPELGAPITPKAELEEYGPVKTVIAAGPFSNSNVVNYGKFNAFVDRINTVIKPDVVVLLGPFIDLNNKSVSEGNVELDDKNPPATLDELFKRTITPILKKVNPKIQVILIPSTKDATVKHCSYPQDAFDRRALGLPKNVKVFPNPSGFSVNEALFGCSNLDIFKDLKDVLKLDPNTDKIFSNRFERITNHILEQRRYYPFFPGSINKASSTNVDQIGGAMAEEFAETKIGGSSLEVPYLALSEIGDSLPDVLLVPSELKYFARVIKNVIVINPGSFIRPSRDSVREDGTYVVVNTEAPKDLEEAQEGMCYHNVAKRSRIDIFKS